MTLALESVQDCKIAALQFLSDVQAHGALVAIHGESNRIEYCSANTAEFLGVSPEKLLGRTGAEGLEPAWPQLSTLANGEGRLEWCELAGRDGLVAIGHRQGAGGASDL